MRNSPCTLFVCALLCIVLCGCNAFTDVDSVGPGSEPSPANNTAPNIATNNIATNNISTNNIVENNISLNNLVANNATTPPNSSECLPRDECGTCNGLYQVVSCDDPTCPTKFEDEVCGIAQICENGDCISCETCPPGLTECDGETLIACATTQGSCTLEYEFDCGAESCNAMLGQCDLIGKPCMPEGDTRCLDTKNVAKCALQQDSTLAWELSETCTGDDTCFPGDGACALTPFF